MTIDTTIDQYRSTKGAMESIIDQHMNAAFDEIRAEFGDTPTSVSLHIIEHHELGQKYPTGHYSGCDVSLDGE
ncbi:MULTISPECIES: hypothetical protein [unclassified Halomonas]|uniref:hypothetical protein n=1 Tax=unclassified Halomonas TaxID=2609666 RepID=UPI00207699E6|nr:MULTISPECIES: hypothetical protein [unclassified Halomonas]